MLRLLAFLFVLGLSSLVVTAPFGGGPWQIPGGLLCGVFLLLTFPWWIVTAERELPDVFADVVRPDPATRERQAPRSASIGVAVAVAGINALGWVASVVLVLPAQGRRAEVWSKVLNFLEILAIPSALVGFTVYLMLRIRHAPPLSRNT